MDLFGRVRKALPSWTALRLPGVPNTAGGLVRFVNGIWRNGLFALTFFYIVFICFLSTETSVEILFI